MTIEKKVEGNTLTLSLSGRLDTVTSPDFEKEIINSIPGVTHLVLDFEKLEYVSSAGLRVILSAQKLMNRQGDMLLVNVNEYIKSIFEMTGFNEILNIE